MISPQWQQLLGQILQSFFSSSGTAGAMRSQQPQQQQRSSLPGPRRTGDVPPTDGTAYAGMNQGPAGVAQGPAGAAVARTFGAPLGIARANYGGMLAPGSAGGGNPYRPIIDSLAGALLGNFDPLQQQPRPGGVHGGPLR